MAGKETATIISTNVICKESDRYIGWPTIVRRANGELLTVFSGDRDEHVCPWGKTQMVRSQDGGKTWTAPVTINNTPLDDRDAGIIETKQGTLLVSWFTSLEFDNPAHASWMPPEWRRHGEKILPCIREQWLGHWVRRSVDGGKSWDDPVRTNVTAPHGPIQLEDGRLLYLGNARIDGKPVIAAETSSDDGKTWQVIGAAPVPDNKRYLNFCEPHVVETKSGMLIGMLRVEPPSQEERFLYQTESANGGRTWTEPRKTTIWGYPPHLIRLRNGWLLVVYGRRIPPFGECACISRDDGGTWDIENEIALCNALNDDLGYPASVELEDGSILTVYYQIDQQGEKTCLMGTRWRLNEQDKQALAGLK